MARSASPDGRAEALWLRSDRGAVTPSVDSVVLVPAGEIQGFYELAEIRGEAVIKGEYLAPLIIEWLDGGELKVTTGKGEIYSNKGRAEVVLAGGEKVEV